MTVYDRQQSIIHCTGTKRAFAVDNFERLNPWETEERWSAIETRVPAVYDLIRARQVLRDDTAINTLIDLMALHWARSPGLRRTHERIADQVIAASHEHHRNADALLGQAFTQRTGLVPASRGELDWTNDQLHSAVAEAHREEWWSERSAINFQKARELFARSTIQVGFARGSDFIIGDTPVITRKEGHDGLGPHQGVAIGDSVEIVMPIAPDILIGLGSSAAYVDVDRAAVKRYNQFQVQSFERWLAWRPQGDSDSRMRANLPARTVLSFRPKGSKGRTTN